MTLAPWIALTLLSGADEPSAKDWAARLISAGAADRAAAADALDALGLRALPALRAAVAASEGEARLRAEAQIDRIATRRLLRPTLVTVGLDAAPVAEAVETLGDAAGFAVVLDPAGDARWKEAKVSLPAAPPVGFFEALERLGAAGGFRHDPSPSFAMPPARGVRVRLVPHDGPRPPTAFAGPYRATLLGLERRREVVQARDPSAAKVAEQFAATLDVVAEPGILIDPNGPVRIREAVDDRGRDLRPDAGAASGPVANPFSFRSWSQEQIGVLAHKLPLKLPEDRGRKIARLRGYVPITAVARTDEIFSAPLAGIQGKTLGGGGVTLAVTHAGLASPTMFLEVTVRGEPVPDPNAFAAGPRQTTQATVRLGYHLDDHLRIEDADGQPYGTSASGTSPPGPDGTMHFRVNIFPGRPLKRPARLRYFGVAAVATEVPFDFQDLPIP